MAQDDGSASPALGFQVVKSEDFPGLREGLSVRLLTLAVMLPRPFFALWSVTQKDLKSSREWEGFGAPAGWNAPPFGLRFSSVRTPGDVRAQVFPGARAPGAARSRERTLGTGRRSPQGSLPCALRDAPRRADLPRSSP
ncbi:uncharacterized protein LOC110333259 [Mus pahari]|uniref:uncharacterized protein LOC110333259 n=1 Tax=Mus pahari TaxID=10093 RepID=UPI000A310373|nr:uncharacterized protein LOC110333259 [Mus pahari]